MAPPFTLLLHLPHLIIIFFSCFSFTDSTMPSNETDIRALLAIKASIHQDPLNALTSWNETLSADFCTWRGIFCGKKHRDRVVGIYLKSQGLVGSLSPYVGNLSFLRSIDLQNNTFAGSIPKEIGFLRRLEFIDISNNSFSGQIPKNLSQCTNLVYLNVIDNNLSGDIMPQELSVLRKLEALGLAFNSFMGPIPSLIGNLTSLMKLSMAYCNLIGEIPESLSQLRSLKFIQLGMNNLTGEIPLGLFNTSTITYFAAAANKLEGGFPSDIGLTLPNLGRLHLQSNQFTGEVPRSFPNASSLEIISLSDNNFVGSMPKEMGRLSLLSKFSISQTHIHDDVKFISSFTNCTKLNILEVGLNLLSGSLPESVGNLSQTLMYMLISFTNIEGKIPFGIGNLVGMTSLVLSNNNLEGPIPSSIGNLVNLQEIGLEGNKFTNEVPSSFGNLSSLNKLSLHNNYLSGRIPHELGNCTSLLLLDLSHNNLNNTIPREIMTLSSITISFDLSYNTLSGLIPDTVQFLKNLEVLELSNNNLSGAIPNSLQSCKSIQRLYLEGNSLEGEIPSGLFDLKGLEELDLSRNKLNGKIPSFFSDLQLKHLNLSFNALQGEVPTKGVFANKSAISLYGNEELCGGIPELKLPSCSAAKPKLKRTSALIKILIPVITAGLTCLLLSSYFFWFTYKKRKSMKKIIVPSVDGIQFLRLSYSNLLKVTDGFSQANLLGVGRFGSVYKGILEDGQTMIAVKVLKLAVRGASKTFLAECNALRSIRHRNLLKILSACESIDFQGNDFKALIYEFKANGSLENWLHPDQEGETAQEVGKLNLVQKLNIAIDVAHAIEYLHSGTDEIIIHSDLKPSNILLDYDMNAHVGDFGLAKIISSTIPTHQGSSSSAAIKGTVDYVAPEYGMNNLVSTQGDVYSYGILLLELFTNTRPTDDLFRDYSNLHIYVSSALPDRVMEIVDLDTEIGNNMREGDDKVREFVASVLSIGVACSKENPRDRMPMTDVVRELSKIRKDFMARPRRRST